MKSLCAIFAASAMLLFAASASATLISFTVSVTDNGTPSTFSSNFSIPLVPGAADGIPVSLLAMLDVTVTAGPTGATASITPNFGDLMLTNVGACPAGVDIGAGFGTPPNPADQHFQAMSAFTPSPGCNDSLVAFLSFTGSGGGASYDFVGK